MVLHTNGAAPAQSDQPILGGTPDQWDDLQAQIGEWSLANFPKDSFALKALGIVEEIGEFASTWRGRENRHLNQTDALADTVIYSSDLLFRLVGQLGLDRSKYSLGVLMRHAESNTDHNINDMARMCHYALKLHQGIRYTPEHGAMELIRMMGSCLAWMLHTADHIKPNQVYGLVRGVWDKVVSKRDWVNKPMTAASDQETAHAG